MKQIFSNSFTTSKHFCKEVLEPIFGEKLKLHTEDEKFSDPSGCVLAIKQVARIEGRKYDEIYVFDVTISDKVRVANARVNIRQVVNKVLMQFSNAFILFHYQNPEGRSWRFSFMHKDSTQSDTNNAKRFTYVLGPNCPCRTIEQRLSVLENDSQIITNKMLLDAFSVEALSDEFFAEYKEHYLDFVQYITGKRIIEIKKNTYEERIIHEPDEDFYNAFGRDDKRVRDYVKKMMGRLVFLCFLQRKGWLNDDPHYLQNLFKNSPKQDDFLDSVLEPMFFGLLNTRTEERAAYFQSYGWDMSLIPGADKIPYLNGGLFEADENDAPTSVFPKELFSNVLSQQVHDAPKKYTTKGKYDFHDFRGLLDFFAAYNFTIDENDPDDAEVGIDPEMLGKIFENLLEDNKDKGAFYTPKEIVQYMCRESLIAYLTTQSIQHGNTNPHDKVETAIRELVQNPEKIVPQMNQRQKDEFGDALRNVKICDPAIGSGAFPMGLLNELARCRVSIDAWSRDAQGKLRIGDYAALKREIVCNNIYGVDIEQGAIDIARLRFWLSIVVDETTPEALPNLDYKFMCGNSLVTTFDGEYINLDTKNQRHDKVTAMRTEKLRLHDLKQQYYNACGEKKHRLSVDIKDSILTLIAMQLDYEYRSWYISHAQAEQSSLFPEMEQPRQLSFADIKHELPAEKQRVIDLGGKIRKQLKDESIPLAERAQTDIRFFDWRMMFTEVFEGENAGFDIVIGNPPYIKEYTNRDAFDGFRESSPYYIGKMDLWHGFACFGMDLLRPYGVLAFIAQNNWTTNAGAVLMRNKIVSEARIIGMLDFNTYMVFGESASIQTMVMLFEKNSQSDNYPVDYRMLQSGAVKQDMIDLLNKVKTEMTDIRSHIFNRAKFKNKYIVFSQNDGLYDHIQQDKLYLTDDELAQGIVFPQDFLNKKGVEKLGHHNVGDGIFGLTSQELVRLNLSTDELTLVKPYFTSEEITRYYTNPQNHLWMIYTDSSFKKEDSLDEYPNIKCHLDQFVSIFTSDNKPYGLHRARNPFFFQGPKIIALRKCVGRPCFSYNECDCYVTQTFYSIKTNRWNMKFLLGVLNSTLIKFWLEHKGKMQGNNFQLDKEPLLQIPLPQPSVNQQPIIDLVDQILDKKAHALPTEDLEQKIDDLVYDIYELTEEEKSIIRK